jgi:hypothetical protein
MHVDYLYCVPGTCLVSKAMNCKKIKDQFGQDKIQNVQLILRMRLNYLSCHLQRPKKYLQLVLSTCFLLPLNLNYGERQYDATRLLRSN